VCGRSARTVRRAGTGNGATERIEAPAQHAKAAGNSYSPHPTATAPVPDSTEGIRLRVTRYHAVRIGIRPFGTKGSQVQILSPRPSRGPVLLRNQRAGPFSFWRQGAVQGAFWGWGTLVASTSRPVGRLPGLRPQGRHHPAAASRVPRSVAGGQAGQGHSALDAAGEAAAAVAGCPI
jgi:hypothetical protein